MQLGRAGICGTDLKILDGSIPIRYPRVLGHELVGTVVEAASDGAIPPGTRVMVNPGTCCGECYLCDKGRPHLCPRGGLRGRDLDGVFAESTEAPEHLLHPIGEQIGWDEAGLLQVLGTVIHAQGTVEGSAETVVVIGLGVSGILHVQLASERGAGCVIGVTRSRWKRELAHRLGADHVATPEDAQAVVARATDGRGADLVIEAVGAEATVAQAIELCQPGGDVIIYGTVSGDAKTIPYYQLYFKEITLHNPRAALPEDYDAAIQSAAAGRVDLAPLVTARYPLQDADSAFEAARSGQHLKVLLTP